MRILTILPAIILAMLAVYGAGTAPSQASSGSVQCSFPAPCDL